MAEVAVIVSALEGVRKWIETISTSREKREAKADAALQSIYIAASETKLYLASLRRREPQNRETEARLSRLWIDVSLKMRKIDRDLSRRCLLKAEYWSDPESWTRRQIDDSRIGVNRILDEARALL